MATKRTPSEATTVIHGKTLTTKLKKLRLSSIQNSFKYRVSFKH